MSAVLLALLCFVLRAGAQSPGPSEINGIWLGTLAAGPQTLRIQLHLQGDITGPGRCVLDSVDQGSFGIPCSLDMSGSRVTIKVPAVAGSWAGDFSADGRNLTGIWTQSASIPLVFARESAAVPPPGATHTGN